MINKGESPNAQNAETTQEGSSVTPSREDTIIQTLEMMEALLQSQHDILQETLERTIENQ